MTNFTRQICRRWPTSHCTLRGKKWPHAFGAQNDRWYIENGTWRCPPSKTTSFQEKIIFSEFSPKKIFCIGSPYGNCQKSVKISLFWPAPKCSPLPRPETYSNWCITWCLMTPASGIFRDLGIFTIKHDFWAFFGSKKRVFRFSNPQNGSKTSFFE